jgi:hypothetical protein
VGKGQRTKGASFEREIAHAFSDALGLDSDARLGRNIGQARDGGNDLDVPPLAIECKRRKTLGTVYGWLQQCIDSLPAFKAKNKTDVAYPVVIGREDNGVPIVIMRLSDFLMLTRDELLAHREEAA